MNRRTMLTLLGSGVIAGRLDAMQHQMHTIQTRPAEYKLQFFTPDQIKVIDRVADMIIPPDEHSAGAHEAQVASYIDLIVTNSAENAQAFWRGDLDAFEEMAVAIKGTSFLELTSQDQISVLSAAASSGARTHRFFVEIRKLTIAGYYTSHTGLIDELGYQGNQALGSYPGCPANG